MRNVVLALIVLTFGATAAQAQNASWLDKMFKGETSHDFGSVPRGAQLYYRFPMTNIWAVPLQILGVRASCGCVTPSTSTQMLQPRETGFLEVTMDARRFTGAKTVTIYVTVGPQFTSTSTLRVSAVSRSDVVFNPGEINFGIVGRGQAPVQMIDLEYAGALAENWRVTGVVKNGLPVDINLEELYRRPGQVGYRIRTSLKADATAGQIKQELVLKTNDPNSPTVPVLVEATVQASLTVVPGTVSVSNLKVGNEVTRKVVVRSSKPFHITEVDGVGDGIDVDLPPTAGAVQIVTLKFKPSQAGDLHRQLQIKTDLTEVTPATVIVEGKIQP